MLFALLFPLICTPGAIAAGRHSPQIFHAFVIESGIRFNNGEKTGELHLDSWIGGDRNKAVLKIEGERANGKTESLEFEGFYSGNISTFWDLRIGARYDRHPKSIRYFTFGVAGLAPFFFESEADFFVSEDGDTGARLSLENEILFTQRLVVAPFAKADVFARKAPKLEVGAGLAELETGIKARYEITRRFAPYIGIRYERKFGKTRTFARRQGEKTSSFRYTAGLRLMF